MEIAMSSPAEGNPVSLALGILESARISNLNIDVQHHTLSLQSYALWGGQEERHTIVFEGVASFYIVQGAKEARFDTPRADRFPGDTLIGTCDWEEYYPKGIGQIQVHVKADAWASQWIDNIRTRPNFMISLGAKTILLEARLVRIDDTTIEVGYIQDAAPDEN
jgi:hypothetical protein